MIKEIDIKQISNSNNPFTKCIAYFDDTLSGYIEYNAIYDTIDIVNVFVNEEKRNKGIGTKLLNYLIEHNKDKKNITLEVNCENSIALKLYKKFGFEIVATRQGYYQGTDGYLMELKL